MIQPCGRRASAGHFFDEGVIGVARVEMLVQTFYGKPLNRGDVIEVSDVVAERWAQHGIAKPVQESDPEPDSPPKKKGGKKNDAG